MVAAQVLVQPQGWVPLALEASQVVELSVCGRLEVERKQFPAQAGIGPTPTGYCVAQPSYEKVVTVAPVVQRKPEPVEKHQS